MFSTLLNFEVGKTVKCQQITFINDMMPENAERFKVVLSRTPQLDPRIRISTHQAEIIITDFDSKRVKPQLGRVLTHLFKRHLYFSICLELFYSLSPCQQIIHCIIIARFA